MNTTDTPSSDLSEGIMKGILYAFMASVVVFINIMVLVAYFIRDKKKRGILDIFVVSLAVSSILTSITVIGIVAYVRATNNEYFQGKMGECYVQFFFGTMLRLTDVATTTAIAIDRFIALYKPIFYRTKVKQRQGYIGCAIIWLSSAVIATLPPLGVGDISKDMESLCTADWSTSISIVVLTVTYTQFVIVLVCYVGIFKSIDAFVKRQKAMTKSQNVSTSSADRRNSISSLALSDRSNNSLPTETPSESRSSSISFPNIAFESELTDRLCKLSHANIKAALREIKGVEEIELETSMKLKTVKTRREINSAQTVSKASSSVNLRIKAAINRVSWSDSPDDFKVNPTDLQQKMENTTMATNGKLESHRRSSQIPNYVNLSDDVFIENDSNEQTDKEREKKPIRKSLTLLVRDKWRAKKLRRSSSIKHFWKESQHFAKIMGVVVLIFYISWLPLAVSINIVLITGNTKKSHDILWISYNLSLLSSVAIPIAYAVMCKPYREGYRRLWKGIKHLFVWEKEVKF